MGAPNSVGGHHLDLRSTAGYVREMKNCTSWQTAKFVIYTGFVAFFWVLTLVLWVYLANYIYFYRTGHIGPRELAWKGIMPLVNLALVIH